MNHIFYLISISCNIFSSNFNKKEIWPIFIPSEITTAARKFSMGITFLYELIMPNAATDFIVCRNNFKFNKPFNAIFPYPKFVALCYSSSYYQRTNKYHPFFLIYWHEEYNQQQKELKRFLLFLLRSRFQLKK